MRLGQMWETCRRTGCDVAMTRTGMSVPEYRNRLRVALARELLTQTQLDMERIAERSGVGSMRQLRRAWRKLFDAPPRRAREK